MLTLNTFLDQFYNCSDRMKLNLTCRTFQAINIWVVAILTTLPAVSQTFLQGTVKYFNSGSKPAVGVEIRAFGANAVKTNDSGMFILNFSSKKPGDPVKISVGVGDRDGKALEVVNTKELEQLYLPANPENFTVEVFVCRAGQRNESAQLYYDILVTTADATLNKRLIGIEEQLKQDNIDAALIASLQTEKDKIRAERDSFATKAEERALYIASINLDRASDLVKNAFKELNEEKNLSNVIAILDNEKLLEAYNVAHEKESKAKEEIRQVIEGFKLKIYLLLPIFDQKTINQCCYELERIYRNENILLLDDIYCFNWVVNYYPNEINSLVVVPFKEAFDNSIDDSDYGRILAEKTLTAIENARRFALIDRTDFETIEKEVRKYGGENKEDIEKKVKSKNLDDEALYWYGHILKADFILTGTISNVETALTITGYYKATINFTIKVINVRTRKVHVTESFEVTSGSIKKLYNSGGEARSAALESMIEPVKLFMDKFFPLYSKYVRTNRLGQNGEMKQATIDMGLDRGFRLKQKLDIVLVDGDGSLPEIVGTAEIIAIQPNNSTVEINEIKKGKNIESVANKSEVLYFRSKAN